jgi:hypothetical protein
MESVKVHFGIRQALVRRNNTKEFKRKTRNVNQDNTTSDIIT